MCEKIWGGCYCEECGHIERISFNHNEKCAFAVARGDECLNKKFEVHVTSRSLGKCLKCTL